MLSLRPALNEGVVAPFEVQRLVRLAFHVLAVDSHGQLIYEDTVWGQHFLQMSTTVPCVNAAVAAFGATYESRMSDNAQSSRAASLIYYGNALRQLRSELDWVGVSTASLAVASLILASVEILNHRQESAFAHFLGARQALDLTTNGSNTCDLALLDQIERELLIVDVQIASYVIQAPSIEERTRTSPMIFSGLDISSRRDAMDLSLATLHRAYHYIGRVGNARFRSSPEGRSKQADIVEQASMVTELRSVLDSLGDFINSLLVDATRHGDWSDKLAEAHAFHTQLTAALIFIFAIYSPFESAYDKYLHLFRDIISNAAAFLRLKRRNRPNELSRFSHRPGPLSPLFLTCMKCRDPALRRQAISMLQDQGREGPCDGRTLATVGRRLTAIEESSSSDSGMPILNACDIDERHRIHGYALEEHTERDETGGPFLKVSFFRPRIPFGCGAPFFDHIDRVNWLFWSETLQL